MVGYPWILILSPNRGFLKAFQTNPVAGLHWVWAWATLVGQGRYWLNFLFLVLCPDAFEIQRLSSVFLRVKTNVGVRVLYDREGLRLYLQVDQRWVEDTVGLCGTFNGNTQDDFLYVLLTQNQKWGWAS